MYVFAEWALARCARRGGSAVESNVTGARGRRSQRERRPKEAHWRASDDEEGGEGQRRAGWRAAWLAGGRRGLGVGAQMGGVRGAVVCVAGREGLAARSANGSANGPPLHSVRPAKTPSDGPPPCPPWADGLCACAYCYHKPTTKHSTSLPHAYHTRYVCADSVRACAHLRPRTGRALLARCPPLHPPRRLNHRPFPPSPMRSLYGFAPLAPLVPQDSCSLHGQDGRGRYRSTDDRQDFLLRNWLLARTRLDRALTSGARLGGQEKTRQQSHQPGGCSLTRRDGASQYEVLRGLFMARHGPGALRFLHLRARGLRCAVLRCSCSCSLPVCVCVCACFGLAYLPACLRARLALPCHATLTLLCVAHGASSSRRPARPPACSLSPPKACVGGVRSLAAARRGHATHPLLPFPTPGPTRHKRSWAMRCQLRVRFMRCGYGVGTTKPNGTDKICALVVCYGWLLCYAQCGLAGNYNYMDWIKTLENGDQIM